MAKDIDFGRQSADYAQYRPGFPDSFYERLETLAPIAGGRAVDLATGPGVIALEFAKRGAETTGVDIAENQVLFAEKRAQDLGVAGHCRFFTGDAQHTGLEANAFDWVTAGQCWHWFDPDAALAEVQRLLRPAGLLVVARFDYSWDHSEVGRLTDELILRHNPTWTYAFGGRGDFGIPVQLAAGGMELVDEFIYPHDEQFSHEAWRGRMRTCNGVGSRSTEPEKVAQFDRELGELLLDRGFPDPMTIEHRVWAVVARKRS